MSSISPTSPVTEHSLNSSRQTAISPLRRALKRELKSNKA